MTTRLVQGDAAGLKYTFETSAGRLTVTGREWEYSAAGYCGRDGVGEINVTCVVVDRYGRKVSYGKMIRLGSGNTWVGCLPSPTCEARCSSAEKVQVPDLAEERRASCFASTTSGTSSAESGVTPRPERDRQPAKERSRRCLKLRPGQGLRNLLEHSADRKPIADAGANEYAEGLAIQKWEKELKTGKIEYNLPTKMSLPDATTVSVVVHGYEDVSGPVPTGDAVGIAEGVAADAGRIERGGESK